MGWRTMLASMTCVAALAGSAQAQDGFDPSDWAKQFQERMLERQAKRLGLSDEQRAEFLAAHRAFQERMAAAEKERTSAIDKLLTEEQRAKLAEQQANPFGGFGGGGPRVSFGGPGNGPKLPAIASAKSLAKKLGLDEAQTADLEKIYADFQKAQMEAVGDLDPSDPQGMVERAGKIAEAQAEARKKRDERIRKLLNAEQREQFDELAKQGEGGMRASFGLALGGPDGPVVLGGDDGGDPAEGLKKASEMLKGLLGGDKDGGGGLLGALGGAGGAASAARIQKDLDLSEDEAMVLWPLVEQIQELQRSHRKWRKARERALRKALTDGSDAAGQLTELRERETSHRAELALVRDELRALVTVRQEAVLVGHGILE